MSGALITAVHQNQNASWHSKRRCQNHRSLLLFQQEKEEIDMSFEMPLSWVARIKVSYRGMYSSFAFCLPPADLSVDLGHSFISLGSPFRVVKW